MESGKGRGTRKCHIRYEQNEITAVNLRQSIKQFFLDSLCTK